MVRTLSVLVLAAALVPAQKLPFDVEGMLKLNRISEPAVSPDGRSVAFTVQTVDVESNARHKQIFLAPLSGGSPRAITSDGENERPRWSPDSKTIAFTSSRSGSAQVWLMDADGSNPRQFTRLSTEAGGAAWSPDGKYLLFTSEVYRPSAPAK
ncbi:MAG: hypothetical protein NTY38_13190 [Acidobacteria bacterium]|nr:hypothetical protein [Acidobacteriota bacterium]